MSREWLRGSRRMSLLVSVVLVVVLAGCGSNADTPTASSDTPVGATAKLDTVLSMPDLKGQTIVINTFGGSYGEAVKKTLAAPFEAATGAKVVLTTNCCDSLDAQIEGGQFAGDLVLAGDYAAMQSRASRGLFKEDPRLAQIAKARGVDSAGYQNNLITIDYYAMVLAWNTQYANNHPSSWPEFFDTSKFQGTRGLHMDPEGTLEFAVMGTGAPASSVYPIDTDKAFATLTTLRKDTSVQFFSTGADLMNRLGTGEIAYSLAYSNRIYQAIQQGLPVDMTFNQALLVPEGAAIPATAKNVDGAVAFLDFYMQPQIQAEFAKESGVAPAYSKAAEMLDPSVQKYMATAPENIDKVLKVDIDWWMKNTSPVRAAFSKWETEG